MLRKISHTVYDVTYHFTFTPKYRRRKHTGEIKKRIEGMIRFSAQINEFDLLELTIEVEHVHLVLSSKPSFSPRKIMNLIKEGTSNKIRKMYPELAENVWGRSFWVDGYFVGTVGTKNLEDVRRYVREQGRVHGTTAF